MRVVEIEEEDSFFPGGFDRHEVTKVWEHEWDTPLYL